MRMRGGEGKCEVNRVLERSCVSGAKGAAEFHKRRKASENHWIRRQGIREMLDCGHDSSVFGPCIQLAGLTFRVSRRTPFRLAVRWPIADARRAHSLALKVSGTE